MYEELIESSRACAMGYNGNCDRCLFCGMSNDKDGDCYQQLHKAAADAIEELSSSGSIYGKAWTLGYDAGRDENMPRWIPVTERLPECEWGAEVGNIEWISCGMVFAGCFGRGGKYRDAYFRTWTDGTEGIDAKDADYWRQIQIPEPPKEES